MAKRYSREELKAIGMDDNQIRAILNTYAEGDKGLSEECAKRPYVKPENVEVSEQKSSRQGSTGFGATIPINCTEVMQVTSIFDLQTYAQGTLVRFPDFAEGQPFVARVRRPSMLVLAKQGRIPNTLLMSANELFSKGGAGMDGDNENMLADIYSICEIICEAALKEPTYQQIKDAGLELSDDQLMAIFNYTQTGAKALESFR